MMVKRQPIDFTTYGSGLPERDRPWPLRFTTPVIFGPDQIGTAGIAISGYEIRFGTDTNPEEHHVLRVVMKFEPEIDYSESADVWGVKIHGEVGIKDHGHFDDPFSGFVDLLVFAH